MLRVFIGDHYCEDISINITENKVVFIFYNNSYHSLRSKINKSCILTVIDQECTNPESLFTISKKGKKSVYEILINDAIYVSFIEVHNVIGELLYEIIVYKAV